MGDSVREKILQNIETTLQLITAANGYNNTFTPATVQRWKHNGNEFADIPCIVINAAPEQQEYAPDPYANCKLTVHIDVWTRQLPEDTTSTDALINTLLADVKKALMVDYTRGGYARQTNITGNIPFETVEGGGHVGIIIDVEIVYMHLINDPEVAG